MTNNSEFYFPMSSSPSSLPPNPLKLRRKRSKFINIPNPKHYLEKPVLPNSHFHHSCPECLKLFASQKALYGHMRCHPDRDYRGMIRNPKFPISSSSTSSPLIGHQSTAPSTTSAVMSVEDHEVASCLLLLSRTAVMEQTHFECCSCKKVFASHQALGGHRATHKNVKGCFAINRFCRIDDDNYKEEEDMVMLNNNNNLGHKCSICLRVFPTGQALGGHKRCHWDQKDTNSSSSSPIIVDDNGNCGLMDLNLPASTTITGDVDDSSSSYSSANFNLDLRLGL